MDVQEIDGDAAKSGTGKSYRAEVDKDIGSGGMLFNNHRLNPIVFRNTQDGTFPCENSSSSLGDSTKLSDLQKLENTISHGLVPI